MEHKYRGHTGEKWVYGDLLNQFCGCEIVETNLYYKVIPYTVGKYIEKDEKDKPIYEGDIMKVIDGFGCERLYLVIYDEPNFRYALKGSLKYGGVKVFTKNGEVVGNITENAYLLEKQDSDWDKNYKGIEEEPSCLNKQYINKKLKKFIP